MNEQIPNPGSDEAQRAGCKCPVIDNNHGIGAYHIGDVPQFWINSQCSIHGTHVKEMQ